MVSLRVNDNIELRMLVETDAEGLVALDNTWPHAPQIDEWIFGPCTVEGAWEFIRQGMALYERKAGIFIGIWVGGRLAGLLQLERKKYGQTVGIDYALAPAYRGQGIATKACAEALRYIFMEWNMHRVEMWIDVVNRKSCAIPERLGFTREGVHRQLALYENNIYGDIAVYALLKDEWLERQ